MLRPRSVWLRVLYLYEVNAEAPDSGLALIEDSLLDSRVHARSRFRSLVDDARFALYSVHNTEGAAMFPPGAPLGGPEGEHTLIAVREFRRVPLDASSLALTVFTARPGQAVPVVAALAHFVERAVDLYQPAYLLLAHSMERPRTSLLLMAVQDSLALGSAATAAFSLDGLLGELEPLLDGPPESYLYCPETATASIAGPVSPYAV
jgi:hypothetical protein